MSTQHFTGRLAELEALTRLSKNQIANLVVLQGRRRIGKSRLVAEFAKGKNYYKFIGLAPSSAMTSQMQLDEFMRQLSHQFNLPKITVTDWGDAFDLLAKAVHNKNCVILFDEISWMGSLDPTFLAKLKNLWDEQLKQNIKLMLILCGSVSSWIEKNIIASTEFLGRPTLNMVLKELALKDCGTFLKQGNVLSNYEKLKLLSFTGGVPRYLELIDRNVSAETNIRRMCFESSSPLKNEFEKIFHDIFRKKSVLYQKIIYCILNKSSTLDEIANAMQLNKSGDLSGYLRDLTLAGFVAKDNTWNIKNGKASNLCKFRLKDNFLRFYLKFVAPNLANIEKGFYQNSSMGSVIAWSTIAGLQFENLVLNHQLEIINALDIPVTEILYANPFFQRKTKLNPGVQIDLLIQTKFNCFYVCEIKFYREAISTKIIDDMQAKLSRLKLPRNTSCRPVLIHVNGVSESVLESGLFANVLDFGDLL